MDLACILLLEVLDHHLGSRANTELLVDVFEMRVHRPGTDAQSASDAFVGTAFEQAAQDVMFPRGQNKYRTGGVVQTN